MKASTLVINGLILTALALGYALICDSVKCPPETKTVTSPTSLEKRWDGRLEYIDSSDTVFVWGELDGERARRLDPCNPAAAVV